jgi:hypothetical protein
VSDPQSLAPSPIDFVRGDFEALAVHMQHCASAQGRWFAWQGRVQWVQAAAAGRLVTLAFVAVLLAVGLLLA